MQRNKISKMIKLLKWNSEYMEVTYISFHFVKYLFIYLAMLGLSCSTQDIYCIMQDL